MKIFLIGFMGSGKTTMGKKLASYLRYKFIDLDHYLEDKAGMSINEFFKLHGEKAFREFEREIIQASDFDENTVVATGGGAPCHFDNMAQLNKKGRTVYIKMPPKALAGRLKNATDRPLISGLSEQELVGFITEKLKEREPFYEQARFIVNGIDLTAEKLAASIR